jgi:hypothetical protein
MRSYISLALYAFMVFQKKLSPIVVLNLLPTFGEVFMRPWEPALPIAPLTTLKPTAKPIEWIKSLKICYELVF